MAKHLTAVVVLSGGQDSTTCLFHTHQRIMTAIRMGHLDSGTIHAVTFDYGQRHSIELTSAKSVWAAFVEDPFVIRCQEASTLSIGTKELIEVKGILKGTSPLVNPTENVEQYANAESLPGGLEKTFVPSRNLMFLTLASNRAYCLAVQESATHVWLVTGVSQEDFGGYPDCREEFIRNTENAISTGVFDGTCAFHIFTPLINKNKRETVLLANEIQQEGYAMYYALSLSHTCYNGVGFDADALSKGEVVVGCGKCHACLLRDKGFREAEMEDPIKDLIRVWAHLHGDTLVDRINDPSISIPVFPAQ